MKKLTRSDFLKLSGAGLGAAGLMMLTGCGSSSGSSETSSASEDTTASEVESTDTTTEDDSHPNWVSDETVTISFMTSEGSSQTIPEESASREAILEATNVQLDIQTAPGDSYSEKMNIALGTNNFTDIIYLEGGQSTISTYAPEGILQPLMQYVNEETMPNFYKVWTEHTEMKKYLIDGELYAFPVIGTSTSMGNGFGACIRMDLLEENDIPTPTTFDELEDALIELNEIYPGSTPWVGRKGTNQLLATTSYMLGSGFGSRTNPMYWDHDEGAYIFGPASENFKAVLEYLNRCYESGVLDPEYATSTQENMEAKMENGQAFFYLDNSGFAQNYTKILIQIEGQEDGVIQLLPTLENSFGKRRAESYATIYLGRFYGINAGCEHMDELIKFIDFLYSDEGYNITNYGKEGYSYELDEDGTPHYIQEYLEQFAGASPSSFYAVYSDLGVGQLDLCLLLNAATQLEILQALDEWTDDVEEFYEIVAADDAYVEPHIEPSFTTEESERSTDILTDLTTYLDQTYDNFIMGVRDISEWDSVIAELESMGVRELEEIYNNAEARAEAQ